MAVALPWERVLLEQLGAAVEACVVEAVGRCCGDVLLTQLGAAVETCVVDAVGRCCGDVCC
jgi:hypothetical protein